MKTLGVIGDRLGKRPSDLADPDEDILWGCAKYKFDIACLKLVESEEHDGTALGAVRAKYREHGVE